MSNFDFMNNAQYLAFPPCRELYEYACAAEGYYFSDHQKCALNVRFILEQFCIFVSEMKNAEYPVRTVTLGNYWRDKNKKEFLKAFGSRNVALIQDANAISCSFLHSEMPTREDIYPQMLKKVYLLLLWLYKELGLKTTLSDWDYSEKKIPRNEEPADRKGEIRYSSDELLAKLKNYFPNCNTEQLCNIERVGDKLIVKNMKGEKIDEMAAPEVLAYSEEQIRRLKQQLENIKKDFDRKAEEFLQSRNADDLRIGELEKELSEAGKKNSIREKILREEIEKLGRDKEKNAETYRDMLGDLGNKYNELQEKYEEALPAKAKQEELQKQIKSLLKERDGMEKNFARDQKKLLEEIQEVKGRLEKANKNIYVMNSSAHERNLLIGRLEEELTEKEKLLESVKEQAEDMLRNFQGESVRVVEEYRDKINSMEIIMTRIMAENMQFKEMLAQMDHSDEVEGYLQIIHQEIVSIEAGNELFQENPDERRLREYLLQVKEHYESMIQELNDRLARKEEELRQEKQRYEELFRDINARSEKAAEENDGNYGNEGEKELSHDRRSAVRWKALVVPAALLVILLLFVKGYWDRSGIPEQTAISDSRGYEDSGNSQAQAAQKAESESIQRSVGAESENIQRSVDVEGASLQNTDEDTQEEGQGAEGDDKIQSLLEETEKAKALDSYRQIEGINEKLLEELDSLDESAFRRISMWSEQQDYGSAYYIGTVEVPVILRQSRGFLFGRNSACKIGNMNDNEVIKFAYFSQNGYGGFMAAVSVTDLCGQLDTDSTMEDVNGILGNNLMNTAKMEGSTYFATAEKETACLYEFKNEKEEKDTGERTAIQVNFDENGKICDYVYIYLYEKY